MDKPALYAEANNAVRVDVRNVSAEFTDELGKMSGRCLDIGTGPGDVAVDFILPKLNSKADLVCSDISDEMVNFGNEKYKENRRVTYIKLDILSPDLPDDLIEEFDHVTSMYCFHWCKDVRPVFKNIWNLLRPGGTAFVTFIADISLFDAYEALAAMPQYQPYMKDVDRWVPILHHDKQQLKTLKALLEEVGFEIHHCSRREVVYTFNSRNELETLLLSLHPFTDRMPGNLKKKYLKDLVKEIVRDDSIFNEDDDNQRNFNLLYHTLVMYISKPVNK